MSTDSKMNDQDRYQRMKYRVAGYSMNICSVIKNNGGSLSKHFKRTTAQSGELKAEKIKDDPSASQMAHELTEMLDEFDTPDYWVETTPSSVKVMNPTCGCLEPFVKLAAKYGFTEKEARDYSCANCIPAYRQMTLRLGGSFSGKLTPAVGELSKKRLNGGFGGCIMEFRDAASVSVPRATTQSSRVRQKWRWPFSPVTSFSKLSLRNLGLTLFLIITAALTLTHSCSQRANAQEKLLGEFPIQISADAILKPTDYVQSFSIHTDLWIEAAMRGLRSPDIERLFAHEIGLIDRYFANIGKGLFAYNKRFLYTPSELGAQFNTIRSRLVSGSALVRRANRLLTEHVFPLLDQNMPHLLVEAAQLRSGKKKRYRKSLPLKLEKDTIRNFYFTEWTRELHGSPAPEMARFWLSVAHPIYDAVFDSDLEASKLYTKMDRIKRLTRIMTRDFDLPAPILGSEVVMITIIKKLEAALPEINRQLYFDYLLKLHFSQIESTIQNNFIDIPLEQLRQVEFLKGGYSMHVFVLMADRKFTQQELDVFFLEGALLQHIDDFLDLNTDKEEGVKTLVSTKMITPEDLWQMRDIVFSRMTELEEQGQFSGDAIDNYLSNIDVFLHKATAKYEEEFGSEGPQERPGFLKKKKVFVGNMLLGAFKYTLGIPLGALARELFPILGQIE